MSYRQLCSQQGLGYDLSSVKTEAVDYARESNAEVAQQAVNKMSVSAAYAGPILKAEQDSFDLLLRAGAQGKLPTPTQFAGSLANLGSGIVAVAATGACGPLGPAAPVCGMAAGYATQKIGEAIFGSGGDCGTKINGMCADKWWAQRNAAVLARCPPGSDVCRKRLQDLWKRAAEERKKDLDAYLQWRKDCTYAVQNKDPYGGFVSSTTYVPKSNAPASCWKQCGAWSLSKEYADCMAKAKQGKPGYVFRNWSAQDQAHVDYIPLAGTYVQVAQGSKLLAEETRILVESRYEAEYRFIQAVDQQTDAMRAAFAPKCMDEGCIQSVEGILGEGAYESAVALRSSTGGPVIAEKILKNSLAQAEGAILTSSVLSKAQSDTIRTSSALSKAQSDIMSAQARASESEQSSRKWILGLAAVAVVAAGAYAYTRRR